MYHLFWDSTNQIVLSKTNDLFFKNIRQLFLLGCPWKIVKFFIEIIGLPHKPPEYKRVRVRHIRRYSSFKLSYCTLYVWCVIFDPYPYGWGHI